MKPKHAESTVTMPESQWRRIEAELLALATAAGEVVASADQYANGWQIPDAVFGRLVDVLTRYAE